jgi:hypothetical protein
MNLTEDNQVIEKLPATTSDPPLRRSILPGTRRAYPLGFHAAACQNIGYLVAKFAVAIKNRASSAKSVGTASLDMLPSHCGTVAYGVSLAPYFRAREFWEPRNWAQCDKSWQPKAPAACPHPQIPLRRTGGSSCRSSTPVASVTPGQLGGRAQFWLPITFDYVTLGPFAGYDLRSTRRYQA